MKRKLLSIMVTFCMALGLMSTTVFAGQQEESPVHKHCVCGEGECTDTSHTTEEWTGVESLSEITANGRYYLKNSVSLAETWRCNYDVKLCLNGNSINGTEGKNVIVVEYGKSLVITDCKDSGSITGGSYGIVNHNKLTLWKGTVKNAVIGVYNDDEGVFVMHGGTLTQNYASSGAGICNYGEFTMTGGSITENRAGISGGGIYNTGTIKLSGSPKISGNSGGNVFLCNKTKICVESGLASDANVGITAEEPADGLEVVTGTTSNTGFTSDDKNYELESNGSGLALTAHKHCVCGGNTDIYDHTTHDEDMIWTGIESLGEIQEDGNYVLKNDVNLTNTWTCKWDVKLCLNGYSITSVYYYEVINVEIGASLDITDCHTDDKVGRITNKSEYPGRGIESCGNLTLWNGSVTGNTDSGVVILRTTNAVIPMFKMYGGAITDNEGFIVVENVYGGGVYNAGGTFEMYGGTISNNSVEGDEKSYGGGVYNYCGTFNMYGGTISNNIAVGGEEAAYGGGVYNHGNDNYTATFTMSGGIISGNTAGYCGGGVCNSDKTATFIMTGGSITENSVTLDSGRGGGVFNAGTFKVSGAPYITGNTVNGKANNAELLIRGTHGCPITVDAQNPISKDANIGITGTENQTVVKGTTATMGFTSDSKEYELADNGSGGLKLVKKTMATAATTGSTDKSQLDSKNPKTGDNGNISLWIALMAAGVAAIGATVVYRKKRYN